MVEVNILHLSDLHFDKNENLDDNPSKYVERANTLQYLLNTFKNFEDSLKPEIIIISGDVAWAGKSEDYEMAKNWLSKLMKILEIKPENIIICPGNHDLDREKKTGARPSITKDADDILDINKIDNFYNLFRNFIKFQQDLGIPPLKIGKKKNYLVGQRIISNIRFVVVNSSWFAYSDKDVGHLWIGLSQIKMLETCNQICTLENYNTCKPTIAIIHHTKKELHESEQSIINNRRPAYDYLAERCHIILSGHLHSEIPTKPYRISKGAHIFIGGASYKGEHYRNNFSIIKINIENLIVSRKIFIGDPLKDKWSQWGEDMYYNLNSIDVIQSIQEIKKIKTLKKEFVIIANPLNSQEIRVIHLFLDDLNKMLYNDFSIISDLYFPDSWKVAIIINKTDTNLIRFSLIPISWELNLLPILEIPENRFDELRKKRVISNMKIRSSRGFIEDYKTIAKELVLERLQILFDTLNLEHHGITFLKKEFIIAYLDKYQYYLNLEKKEEYYIEEIESRLSLLPTKRKIVPFSRISQPALAWGELNIGALREFFSNFKERNQRIIRRIYQPPDYSRVQRKGNFYNSHTQEELEYNIKVFFGNLPDVYYRLLKNNFPHLVDKIPIFKGATTLLIETDLKDYYSDILYESPWITIIGLKNEEGTGFKILFSKKGDNKLPEVTEKEWEDGIQLNDKRYKVTYGHSCSLDFLYTELPMFKFVYKMLYDNLLKYLQINNSRTRSHLRFH